MPSRLDTNFPQPTDPEEFEAMVRDICALEWSDPHTARFGRSGQKQYGVDVYGQPIDLGGKYRAAQCKLRKTRRQLSKDEIEKEVKDARSFPHELESLIIVTTGVRDTSTQETVDQICQLEVDHSSFRVSIWFWDNIVERLAAYPRLIVKYYPDFFANLTTLPTVERLIDTPLQVVSDCHSRLHSSAPIEEYLRLRGIRVIEARTWTNAAVFPPLSTILPDGIVCSTNTPVSEITNSTLLQIAGKVQSYLPQIESRCPVFVVLPRPTIALFLQLVESLGVDLERIQILVQETPYNELVDHILDRVFHFGYSRRGGPATMNMAIRTREGRPDSVLLDLDWRSKLTTSHFPSPLEWKEDLLTALMAVRSQLLSQSDRARIHINCQLPVPAALAVGFYFNIRVARLGVWARKAGSSDFKQQFWLSDGTAASVIFEPQWVKSPVNRCRSAVVELTSQVPISDAVEEYCDESSLAADSWLQMRLEDRGQPIANITESYAVAYANQVGQVLRKLNAKGVTEIHLFARIPSPLAVLIGQRLQACGHIHCYWFDNPTYRFAFVLQ